MKIGGTNSGEVSPVMRVRLVPWVGGKAALAESTLQSRHAFQADFHAINAASAFSNSIGHGFNVAIHRVIENE